LDRLGDRLFGGLGLFGFGRCRNRWLVGLGLGDRLFGCCFGLGLGDRLFGLCFGLCFGLLGLLELLGLLGGVLEGIGRG